MIIEQRIRREVQKISGIDPFTRTRKREVVEARGLYINILHKYHKKGCSEIGKGLKLNHATILHSIKNFDIYVRFNPTLKEWLEKALRSEEDIIPIRKEYIKDKLDYLKSKDILELSSIVRDMYEEALIEQNKKLDKLDRNER